jgi:hypothetical protein
MQRKRKTSARAGSPLRGLDVGADGAQVKGGGSAAQLEPTSLEFPNLSRGRSNPASSVYQHNQTDLEML